MNEQQIRELLAVAFEYSYLHEDWSNPLDQTLEGITAEQAAWRASPESMGIWDMVLHLAAWNENIIERIQTGENTHPTEGAWPPKPDVPDEHEWEAAKARLLASLDGVKNLIQTAPFEKIQSSPYGFPDLACRCLHMAYHIGQIVKIREIQGW